MENKRRIFMETAVGLSSEGMRANKGGPFGAVVVKNGEIVGRGYNQVCSLLDPTAHAEVMAIRDACKNLETFELTDCEIYTSCEPCPMCLSAIYWARISRVYYANTRNDAADIGFDDSLIYDELKLETDQRKIPMIQLEKDQALKVFKEWQDKEDKIEY